jgi:phosphatidylserine decarboxylase
MPSSARPMVAIGSRAIAGETILADMTAGSPR